MKKTTLVAALFVAFSLQSCGGGEEKKTDAPVKPATEESAAAPSAASSKIKPSDVSVKGALKGYLEVIPGDYEIKKDGDKWKATVKIKVAKPYKKEVTGQEITLAFYDADGKPVDLKDGFRIYEQNDATINGFIAGEAGTEEWLTMESFGDYEKSYAEGLPAEIAFFALETRVY